MRKIFMLMLAVLAASGAKSQSQINDIIHHLGLDLALGAAIPQGPGAKGGVLLAVQPQYQIGRHLSAGFRFEAALTARGFQSSYGSSSGAKVAASGSYMLIGDYCISLPRFSPFVGAGIGVYRTGYASFDEGGGAGTIGTGSATKIGELVRAGITKGNFRASAEYNLVPNSSETVADQPAGGSFKSISRNSYLGVKFGLSFGGKSYGY
jgi:hypothetical protein